VFSNAGLADQEDHESSISEPWLPARVPRPIVMPTLPRCFRLLVRRIEGPRRVPRL